MEHGTWNMSDNLQDWDVTMDDFGYLFRTFIGYIYSTFSILNMFMRSTDPRFTFWPYSFIYLLRYS